MRIGIVGAGNIGANAGRQFVRVGHEVLFSFSRDSTKLQRLAGVLGPRARAGSPREAVEFGEVVMLAVPWGTIDEALRAAGPLAGKVLIDTTNQFGPTGVLTLPDGVPAAVFNDRRMPGVRHVKAFNTLTAGFQAAVAGRSGDDRAAMFLAGEDADARQIVAALIAEIGFAPVDLGGWDQVWIMEAPRRPGAVYGEEYRPDAAQRIATALHGDRKLAARLADELKVQE
jgi:predicted dinucleotide-binding enzyme